MFPKLRANSSEARFTKSPKTWAPKKKGKRRKYFSLIASSGVSYSTVGLRGILRGISLNSR